jgi:hypothetical protein
MGLLDKLKPTPRWKHADPAVRLEAVRDLVDPAELGVLAESDPDARVRRAAVSAASDVAVLGRVASADADAETRDRAADRLLALAASGELDVAVLAVRAILDGRRLSAIARGDAPEPVRAEALARLTDARSLVAVAKHATHDGVARAAAARLTEPADLVEVAQNSEHKDVALETFERLVPGADAGLLRSIETRAQQKAVARRARQLIQELGAAEAARQAAAEERRRQEAALVEAAARLADVRDPAAARASLAGVRAAWTDLAGTDEAATARFEQAAAAAEAAAAAREREEAAAVERARQREEAIATREALCARAETLEGDDILAQLAPLEEEWRLLSPLVGNGDEAIRLADRFGRAAAACRARHELGARAAETARALDALVVEAEALAAADDAAAVAARWPSLAREARGRLATLAEAGRADQALAARLQAVDVTLADRAAQREAARRAAVTKAQSDACAQLVRLADRARRALEADAVTLREGDRLMRDIGLGLEAAQKVDGSRELDEAAAALRRAQEAVAPRIRELREMDDWRRFANGQRQEQLIAMAEAIVNALKSDAETAKDSDLAATARALRELHAKWHEVAEGPRQSAQRLWDRFRLATDFIRARSEPYFAAQREQREAGVKARAAVVAEAEALASSTEWGKAAARFQELQAAWNALPPAPREAGRELGLRFRTAVNAFFARRREDLSAKKKVWAENQAQKDALCARAEELAQSTEWDSAAAEIKKLQAAWKQVGPVRRAKSDELWNRFRAAADAFFERYHNRHHIALAGKLAEREALVVELEALATADPDQSPADLADRLQTLRTTWTRAVPIPSPDMKPLHERWHAALARIVSEHGQALTGTEMDPAAIVKRMERLVARVEPLVAATREVAAGASATELLAARLRSALASNAMGGRASDDSKWRSAADTVKEAQSAWQRLAPVVSPEADALERRFKDACRRVLDEARRHAPPQDRKPPRSAPRMAQHAART